MNTDADNRNPGQNKSESQGAGKCGIAFAVSSLSWHTPIIALLASSRNTLQTDGYLKRLADTHLWYTVKLPRLGLAGNYQDYAIPYHWLIPSTGLINEGQSVVAHVNPTMRHVSEQHNTSYSHVSNVWQRMVIQQAFNSSLHSNKSFLNQNLTFASYRDDTRTGLEDRMAGKVDPIAKKTGGALTDQGVLTTSSVALSSRSQALRSRSHDIFRINHATACSREHAERFNDRITDVIAGLGNRSIHRIQRQTEVMASVLEVASHNDAAPRFDSGHIQNSVETLLVNSKQQEQITQNEIRELKQQLTRSTQQQSQTLRLLEQAIGQVAQSLQQVSQPNRPRLASPTYYGRLK